MSLSISGGGGIQHKTALALRHVTSEAQEVLGQLCVSYIFLFLLLFPSKLPEASFAALCTLYDCGGFIFGSSSVTIG